jgi:hypothetical protein
MIHIGIKMYCVPKISFFEGIEGIKRIYEDTLNFPDQEILMWGAPEAMEIFDTKFLENYYQII